MRQANKRRIALNPAHTVKNAWAYLPDLGRAFMVLAENHRSFGSFENFHFAGHLVTADETFSALQQASSRKLKQVGYPWLLLRTLGLVKPILRGLVQMRYVWEHELALADSRLDALLGEQFGTPFDVAMARTAANYLAV
jgi:nucleoside-diphosphate-sugar epimerase